MKNNIAIIIIIIFSLVLGFMLFSEKESAIAPENNGQTTLIGGKFSLTDQNGKRVTDNDLKGKYSLVFFGFTSCPEVCPTTLSSITLLMQQLGNLVEKVTPVFVSVDAGDKPKEMKEYLSNFYPSIIGLTGTEAEIKQATDSYKVYYQKVPQLDSAHGYTIDHSAYVYLMDKQGNYLAHVNYNDTIDKMLSTIKPYLEK